MPARVLQLLAPDLEDIPVAGMGCCGAIAPDDLARGELDSWPGVHVQSINVASGLIVIALAEAAPPVEDLLEALHDLGITAHVTEEGPT